MSAHLPGHTRGSRCCGPCSGGVGWLAGRVPCRCKKVPMGYLTPRVRHTPPSAWQPARAGGSSGCGMATAFFFGCSIYLLISTYLSLIWAGGAGARTATARQGSAQAVPRDTVRPAPAPLAPTMPHVSQPASHMMIHVCVRARRAVFGLPQASMCSLPTAAATSASPAWCPAGGSWRPCTAWWRSTGARARTHMH